MNKQERAIITVVGMDEIGILAKVATAVAESNASVAQVSQVVMDGVFTMTMQISIAEMTCGIQELKGRINDLLPNVVVHVMHENIFTSMHHL